MSPHTTPSSLFILTRRTHRYPVQREMERSENRRGADHLCHGNRSSKWRRQWIPTTVFQVKCTGGAGDRLTGGDDGGGRQTWLQNTGGGGGGDFNSFRQVHREDTRRRWWLPPELRSSSNLVLVLRFRFQILFGMASGVTDQIQERSTVNPVKISSFRCRFSGLFRSRFGSSSFVTGIKGLVTQLYHGLYHGV
ncbi:uncharacterized protein LOC110869215 [Helianthus annuus]|uniref:uncharacterized protein LOC110869215 n=1 Tax=Helianthus annuus TaxID=4232 RepID=UPI00165334CB|nr:uncharacterized protein LOC110869215 [Helianthus annuus]